MIDRIMDFIDRKGMLFPIFSTKVQAEFAGPSDDIPAERLDLAAHLVPNPASTFFVRAAGDSMTGVGIFANDLLVVDKSLEPKSGDIVVAVIDGEFTVKRYIVKNKKIELRSENSKSASTKIAADEELNIWGVVKNVVHSV